MDLKGPTESGCLTEPYPFTSQDMTAGALTTIFSLSCRLRLQPQQYRQQMTAQTGIVNILAVRGQFSPTLGELA